MIQPIDSTMAYLRGLQQLELDLASHKQDIQQHRERVLSLAFKAQIYLNDPAGDIEARRALQASVQQDLAWMQGFANYVGGRFQALERSPGVPPSCARLHAHYKIAVTTMLNAVKHPPLSQGDAVIAQADARRGLSEAQIDLDEVFRVNHIPPFFRIDTGDEQ